MSTDEELKKIVADANKKLSEKRDEKETPIPPIPKFEKGNQKIVIWLRKHPFLNLSALEDAIGAGAGTLLKAVKGNRNLAPTHFHKLADVLTDYGLSIGEYEYRSLIDEETWGRGLFAVNNRTMIELKTESDFIEHFGI